MYFFARRVVQPADLETKLQTILKSYVSDLVQID